VTYPSVETTQFPETTQSGAAADAVRTLQAELSADYSELRSAEIQLTEAILSAHAVTVSGRTKLQDIQRQLIEAITNPVAALDTPAGERHFLMFLRGKIAEIQAVVDTGSLTDEDHAALTRALGSGYLLPAPPSTTARDVPSQSPDQAAGGMMPAVGSALGALPQAAQGAAAAPAQGAGGLTGAATPLAGMASGLLDRAGQSDSPEDRAEAPRDADQAGDADESADSESDDEAPEDDTEDRATEPSPPSDREPPENGPAQTRPARLL
jgi:hypothetical protein